VEGSGWVRTLSAKPTTALPSASGSHFLAAVVKPARDDSGCILFAVNGRYVRIFTLDAQ
jgi:hypothetical protein